MERVSGATHQTKSGRFTPGDCGNLATLPSAFQAKPISPCAEETTRDGGNDDPRDLGL